MTPTDILIAAATLFEGKPERFTQGAIARSEGNASVPVDSPDAFSFSVNGFFERVRLEQAVTNEAADAAFERLDSVCRRDFGKTVPQVNDLLGREAIIKALRSAAK